MMFEYLFPQELAVDMRIDFGGGNLFMSQHLLDSKQVGSPFQQVGGEGMAERMRAHVLFDTGHFCLLIRDRAVPRRLRNRMSSNPFFTATWLRSYR